MAGTARKDAVAQLQEVHFAALQVIEATAAKEGWELLAQGLAQVTTPEAKAAIQALQLGDLDKGVAPGEIDHLVIGRLQAQLGEKFGQLSSAQRIKLAEQPDDAFGIQVVFAGEMGVERGVIAAYRDQQAVQQNRVEALDSVCICPVG